MAPLEQTLRMNAAWPLARRHDILNDKDLTAVVEIEKPLRKPLASHQAEHSPLVEVGTPIDELEDVVLPHANQAG